MALKVWDGWDHYNSGLTDMKQRSGFLQYFTFNNAPGLTFVSPGRNGNGKALRITTNITGLQLVYQDRNDRALVGMAVLQEVTSGTESGASFLFMDTVTDQPQVTIFFNRLNYSVEIWRASNDVGIGIPFTLGVMLYASPNNVWAPNVWNFIEMEVKVHDSAGLVTVRSNGVTIASVSGVDTKFTANAWWDALYMSPTGSAGISSMQIDDHYYADKTVGGGTFPADTFLGDAKVVTLFATGNDSVQWTPLSLANWQMISEIAMDSDTTYNYTATPGNQDTFVFQSLAGTITTIYGIQVTYATRKDDAGMKEIKGVVKSGGTSYFGDVKSIPDSNYVYFTDLWILDPDTGANWTLSGVNAANYGYKLVS